jgi:hypothetical protein
MSDVKLCECGCGQPAPISPDTNRPKGYTKGQPRRFVNGHGARVRPPKPPKPPLPLALCQCGCGQLAPRGRAFRRGHYSNARAAEQRGTEYVIPLTRGAVCAISPEDTDLANVLWHIDACGYAVRFMPGQRRRSAIGMHRVILERMLGRPLQASEEVDHRDGDPLNNTRANLRAVTHQQNTWNRGRPRINTSGYKGVSVKQSRQHSSKPWQANITVNKRNHHLGYFATAEEASAAYRQAEVPYFGDFKRD